MAVLLLAFQAHSAEPGLAEPVGELTQKQIVMLASEAQYFSALAQRQKDELDKLKASCNRLSSS